MTLVHSLLRTLAELNFNPSRYLLVRFAHENVSFLRAENVSCSFLQT